MTPRRRLDRIAHALDQFRAALSVENRLIFRPVPAAVLWEPPPDDRIADVTFATADGVPCHAWWLPPPAPESPVILICHGNAGNLSGRGRTLLRLQAACGAGVFIFDYPGYGRSAGRPSERGCYAAADAAYRWLVETQGVTPERMVLYGESLGGAVAVELATRRPHRALVLVKTFTTIGAVARRIARGLPVGWFMRNRFGTMARLARCARPALVAHGTADALVPFAHGEAVFAALPGPKRFVRLEGHGHNDRLPDEFFAELGAFLAAPGDAGQPTSFSTTSP